MSLESAKSLVWACEVEVKHRRKRSEEAKTALERAETELLVAQGKLRAALAEFDTAAKL